MKKKNFIFILMTTKPNQIQMNSNVIIINHQLSATKLKVKIKNMITKKKSKKKFPSRNCDWKFYSKSHLMTLMNRTEWNQMARSNEYKMRPDNLLNWEKKTKIKFKIDWKIKNFKIYLIKNCKQNLHHH